MIHLFASAPLLLPRGLQDFFSTFTSLAHLCFVWSKTYTQRYLKEDVALYYAQKRLDYGEAEWIP